MSNHSWKSRAVRTAGWVALGVCLAGCHTVIRPPAGGDGATTATEGFNTPAELVQQLNFGIRTSPETPEAKALAERIERQVAGRLIADGQTLKPAAADLLLDLTVRQSLFDQSGEFILLEGGVDGTLKRLYDGKLLAHDRIEAKGKRELGADKAVASLAEALAPKLDAWIKNACAPERIPMAACVIDVRRSWMTTFTPGSKLNAEYAERFVKAVSGMPGVLRCELVGEEPNERLMRFRILYLKDQYPQGLLNAILVANENLRLKR